ncbi:MAG TPA: TasA family protein [Anaerolineae bacterium]|nr:TasA family protein [Anaerolineae bacterium]HOR01220.1 TasA family protein [Anaerolineae bacterium]HOR01225.1 TasA family protein [Anaerolineae bacterium]HPL27557.1 TasA family protein [Anaerolineae bacterium]
MRTRLVLSVVIALLLVGVLGSGLLSTGAYYSDTETSTGNTFSAGTLDLAVDGNNGSNTVKFTVANVPPQWGPALYVFKLDNLGSLAGFIDLHSIAVTSDENGCLEPEQAAGDDPTSPVGELQDLMGLHMFVDEAPSNGWFGFEDTTIHNGAVGTILPNYDLNLGIPALGTKYITAQIGWWSTPDDNKAMSDIFTFDMTFELAQTAAQ